MQSVSSALTAKSATAMISLRRELRGAADGRGEAGATRARASVCVVAIYYSVETELELEGQGGGCQLKLLAEVFLVKMKFVEHTVHGRRQHQPHQADEDEAAEERVEGGEEFSRARLERRDRPHPAEDHRG